MHRIGLIVMVGVIGTAGCVAIGLGSCVVSSRPSAIVREELVGNYEVTFPFGHSSLRLGSDGRYTQKIEIGGERASTSGTWSRSAEDWFAHLTLQDPLHPTDGFGRMNQGWRTPVRGAFVMPIARRLVVGGPIEVTFDEVYAYRKRQ
jgi:hypothetical protein